MFRRKELVTVRGMEKVEALRTLLAQAGIESTVKMPGLSADALHHAGVGGLEMRTPESREYIILVEKAEYERAAALIRGRI